MKNKVMKKVKSNFKKNKFKKSFIFEMADDFMDMISHAKFYKKMKKKTKM